ncbi:hypothetical protein FHR96_001193 [Halomonas organivorans]|uniref:Group II intron maturase-specific domain-containing protein n=1 Tax=Halomonas organivorans TaxID=257772 RepID=A0A7W5G5E2_9GAMM|nr:hypothetical protein [Halomonas organivorans]
MQVYVRSRRAGERVMTSLSDFLESSLRLTVSRDKSTVERPWNRGYLGYTLTRHRLPKLTLAKASLQRLMGRVREILKRGRGRGVRRVTQPLVRSAWVNLGTGHGKRA